VMMWRWGRKFMLMFDRTSTGLAEDVGLLQEGC
jgi:hypothetical protein